MHFVPFPQAAILLVDLEVQRRRIVEHDLDVEVQKIRHPEVVRLLDRFLVRLQEIHRPVQVLQLQRRRALEMNLFLEPLLVAVELRGRRARPVCHHRKQRPLDVEVELASTADLRDDFAPFRYYRAPTALMAPVGGPEYEGVAALACDTCARSAARVIDGASCRETTSVLAGVQLRRIMKRVGVATPWLLLAFHAGASARGVTPYLPLNLEPEMERQIERVLILADRSVLTRPIAAATVLDALPKACRIDAMLCREVGRYLARYTHSTGVTHASVEGATTSGADTTLPNRYGLHNRSAWAVSGDAYIQPSDYLLVNLGGVAYDGKQDFTGSMISLGFSKAQLDIGYRPRWLSPLTDSSMLISTEAPTMPSVSLSNYEPLTRLGLQYELFVARMSKTDKIELTNGKFTTGYPKFAGVHVGIEPASGWSLAANRIFVFGGGAAGGQSIRDLLNALFNPSRAQTTGFGGRGNTLTSRFIFPGRRPFAVYFEYAGNDTDRGRNYLLGKPDLSAGIDFPRLGPFDLTYEASEWQESWYVHGASAVQTGYLDGITNYGRIIGHWFGDERVFGDAVGGESNMVRVGWEPPFGGRVELRYRTLQNHSYSATNYQRFRDVTLGYSRPWQGVIVGGELDTGRDVFGATFTRVAGFVRYDDSRGGLSASLIDALSGGSDTHTTGGDIFVDGGVNTYRVRTDLTDATLKTTGPKKSGSHFAVGARRPVSDHSDLGARVEFDDIDGHSLIGVRLVDYRYRTNGPLAVRGFVRAARYALATPWRNVLPRWDVGVEVRFDDSIAREHLLPSDPQSSRPTSFYDIWGAMLSISRSF